MWKAASGPGLFYLLPIDDDDDDDDEEVEEVEAVSLSRDLVRRSCEDEVDWSDSEEVDEGGGDGGKVTDDVAGLTKK